jgi:hypothetical protein
MLTVERIGMRINLKKISTESLVSELNRRFYEEAVNKTHAMLKSFRTGDFLGAFSPKTTAGSQGKRRRRRTMSAAARKRISQAQKARWAKKKAKGKKTEASAA